MMPSTEVYGLNSMFGNPPASGSAPRDRKCIGHVLTSRINLPFRRVMSSLGCLVKPIVELKRAEPISLSACFRYMYSLYTWAKQILQWEYLKNIWFLWALEMVPMFPFTLWKYWSPDPLISVFVFLCIINPPIHLYCKFWTCIWKCNNLFLLLRTGQEPSYLSFNTKYNSKLKLKTHQSIFECQAKKLFFPFQHRLKHAVGNLIRDLDKP